MSIQSEKMVAEKRIKLARRALELIRQAQSDLISGFVASNLPLRLGAAEAALESLYKSVEEDSRLYD